MAFQGEIGPDEIEGLAAAAVALIDARLTGLGDAARAAFWASVRRCYNAPYNEAQPRPKLASLPPSAPEAGASQAA